MNDIPRAHISFGKCRELQLVKMTGFDESTDSVKKMPRTEGVVLTHTIHIGSFQAISGWQWFGRPEGLLHS